MKIKNSVVYPLITPFKENGDIDIVGIKKYVDYLISQKVKMIITTVINNKKTIILLRLDLMALIRSFSWPKN